MQHLIVVTVAVLAVATVRQQGRHQATMHHRHHQAVSPVLGPLRRTVRQIQMQMQACQLAAGNSPMPAPVEEMKLSKARLTQVGLAAMPPTDLQLSRDNAELFFVIRAGGS